MKSSDADIADVLVLLGLVLIGYGVFGVFGLTGLVAYAGVVLIALGSVLAYLRGRSKSDKVQ